MLGLSFMGQTSMSVGCLYKDLVVGGFVSGGVTKQKQNELVDVNIARANNSICSGYSKESILDFFPKNMNPNRKPPHQNLELCSVDHNMMEFVDPTDKTLPKVRVCYRYTFNTAMNWRENTPMPCGWDWSDIDVMLKPIDPFP